MANPLRVGTRSSPLALRQTEIVLALLRRRSPGSRFEVRPLESAGDLRRDRAGDFTDRLDQALEEGQLDLVVHSAKDLPSHPTRRVVIGATPVRADPRDALVLPPGRTRGSLDELPFQARVGSSSARRQAQLRAVRPDIRIVEVRGNVGTRLDRMPSLQLDGLILAVAGLARLGLQSRIGERLSTRDFLPAPAQGILAVMARPTDRKTRGLLRSIDHAPTSAALAAEFSFTRELGADCDTPLGALAALRGGRLVLRGALWAPEGGTTLEGRISGGPSRAAELGRRLARSFLAKGAESLLAKRQ